MEITDNLINNINLLLNSLVQSLVVFIVLYLLYKLIIIKKANNLYFDLVLGLKDIFQNLIPGFKYLVNGIAKIYGTELEKKSLELDEEIKTHFKKNDEHNKAIFMKAFWLFLLIATITSIITIISIRGGIKIDYLSIIISVIITGIGGLFEYYFATRIILNHYIFDFNGIYRDFRHKMYQKLGNIIKDNKWEEEIREKIKKSGLKILENEKFIS